MRALMLSLVLALSSVLAFPMRADAATTLSLPPTVAVNWEGPVTIQTDVVGSLEVSIDGPGYSWSDFYYSDGYEPIVFYPAPFSESGRYTVTIYDGSTYDYLASASTEVKAPKPVIRNLRASSTEFFPVVRDDYLDSTTLRFGVNQEGARVRVSVMRLENRSVVRSAWVSSYTVPGLSESWTWNGRKDDGSVVRPGRYRVTVTAINGGSQGAATIDLEVVHGRFPGTMSHRVPGARTSRRSLSSSCYARPYDGSLTLDCWGGRRATADYVFAIPRDAHDFKWRVFGEVNCCDRGVLRKTGKRISPTRYRVRVEVTSWRSFTVHGVSFRYSARLLFRPNSGSTSS